MARILDRAAALLPVRRSTHEAAVSRLATEVDQANASLGLAMEDVSQLERQMYEPGWIKALHQANIEFSAEGLRQLRSVCQLYAIKNPLIKRGLSLRAAYVWALGVNITARATGENPGEQDVTKVINDFLDNANNRREMTGHQARIELEASGFGTAGEIFLALFTRPLTGTVQVVSIPANEVWDVITNPNNTDEAWYYHRRWEEQRADGSGGYTQREMLHPALSYRPDFRPSTLRGMQVRWDAPILHAAVNRPSGWRRGLPDSYAAIDWARAYKTFLEDWATLMRALAQYAWQTNVPGDRAGAMRRKLTTPVENSRGEVVTKAGATAILPPDVALQAVSKTGATFDAESGRPLAAMAASALEVPVTMLMSDPGQAGARSVAETLDQPTKLPMQLRQKVWGEIYRTVLDYVIREAVRAPKGGLKGKIVLDEYGVEQVELDGDTDAGVNVQWPDMDQGDLAKRVDAIVKAHATNTVPQNMTLLLLGQALNMPGIESIIRAILKDDEEFGKPPQDPLIAGAGAFGRAGKDPAKAGKGTMGAGGGGNPSGAKA
jgi:hypothetical protein